MLSPFTKWLPEDDLLLKNAVEAGASLESLAKGAVQFSRRFTIQELQDRWHSLLYDLVSSEDASAHIIEIESQHSLAGPSKASRTSDSKTWQTSLAKGSGQSMQSYYYAMRKRVCSNPCTSVNLDFLVQRGAHGSDKYASGCQDRLHHHNKYQVVDGIPEPTKFNCEHPEAGRESYIFSSAVATGNIPSHAKAHADLVEDELLHEKMEMDFFESLSDHNVSSEVQECTNAKHQLCHSSPPLELPSMNGNEANDAAGHMSGISYYKDKVTEMHSIDDARRIHSNCVGAILGSQLDRASETGLDIPHVVSENDIEFLTPHMNCHEDDHLLDDVHAYMAEKTCSDNIDSIFLISPSGACDATLPNSDEHIATEVSKTFLPDTVSCGEPNCLPGGLNSGNNNSVSCSYSAGFFTSTSPKASCSINPLDGYCVCALNTDDQEIPCNDHVLLPLLHSLGLSHGHEESHDLDSCAMGFPFDDFSIREVTTGNKEQTKHLFQTSNSPRMSSEQLGSDYPAGITRQVDVSVNESNPSLPATSRLHSKTTFDIKEEIIISDSRKFRKYKHCSAYCSAEADTYNTLQAVLPSHEEKTSQELRFSDQFKSPLGPNKEELFSDSECDVPHFADIEAMILDMDLDLYNQGSCPFNMEASRYQSVDGKKAIIRLEQAARSYLNREISAHGAFAILYGRHLRYFIRKPEILMGRATHDVQVDVDLGVEGHTNTISRRQALIKMDSVGSFILKNIGKSSVFINGREVPTRSSIHLKIESLIKVRELSVFFYASWSAVTKYLMKNASSSQPKQT